MKKQLKLSLFVAALVIPVSSSWSGGVTGTLVALNKADATASLIDLKSGEVRATLPTGVGPHEAAVSPDGRLALTANYGTRAATGSSLTLIDLPDARVIGTVDLGDYGRPHGLLWLPDGRRALVTAEADRALLVVDVERSTVERAVITGQEVSHMVAVGFGGRRAFVANIGSGTVSAIDLDNGTLLRTITTGAGAEGITATTDGREVWVTNRAADTVSVIDTKRLEVVATIECASFPIRAKATPDGKHILISCARSGDLAVLDTSTRKVVRRIPQDLRAADTDGRLFGSQFDDSSVPIGIVIHPAGRRAWVAHTNADVIAEIDLQSWRVDRLLQAGREPDGMDYSPVVVGKE